MEEVLVPQDDRNIIERTRGIRRRFIGDNDAEFDERIIRFFTPTKIRSEFLAGFRT
ncbi:hypothetical protein LEP1GSC061_3993 [Leptospira wolffii serovar Khorat str. Khorat-H2]|nr:hypothetical protein LEP1GSC061_3993 [Leptospira wolffii serovar Khorat str. Khorat-H2]